MVAMRYGRLAVLGLACFALSLASTTPRATACPFCSENAGPTLVGDFNQATIVLVGTFSNAKRVGAKDGISGTTEFHIEKRLKDHPLVKGKDVITLPRYLPSNKSKFVIFCDVYRNTIDP